MCYNQVYYFFNIYFVRMTDSQESFSGPLHVGPPGTHTYETVVSHRLYGVLVPWSSVENENAAGTRWLTQFTCPLPHTYPAFLSSGVLGSARSHWTNHRPGKFKENRPNTIFCNCFCFYSMKKLVNHDGELGVIQVPTKVSFLTKVLKLVDVFKKKS